MNQLEVNAINETISYDEGKIYYEEGKNWTSEIWNKLYKKGYRTTSKNGIVEIIDNEGNKVVWAIGRVNALKELAILMH